jgi:hypothetical protein
VQPTQDQIKDRMRARRAARTRRPATNSDRLRAVHAAAYGHEDPICATCHRVDCPRYRRIDERLDQQRAADRRMLPDFSYADEPW